MPEYNWDEEKRRANLEKHGYDFALARRIYEHPQVVTRQGRWGGEARYVDIAPWGNKLLALVYTMRGSAVRVISLRPASRKERRFYEEKYPRG